MEVSSSRQIYSAQGDRRTAFQLPVSKGVILPTTLRQPEVSNNIMDSYLGVGKVRASSANSSKRLAATRNSMDINHLMFANSGKMPGYAVDGESPRIVGNNFNSFAQIQITPKQQQTYDQIKANSQKMNYISEIMATKPPTGNRNISSAGAMGSGSPSPRVLQQYQARDSMLLQPGTSLSAMGTNMQNNQSNAGQGNKGNNSQYHMMQQNQRDNVNVQLSSSMPLPSSRGGSGLDFNVNSDARMEVVSILSTSSASRKSAALRSGGVYSKKRVRFADKIAVFAKESDFDRMAQPINYGRMQATNNSNNTSSASMMSSISNYLNQSGVAAAQRASSPLLNVQNPIQSPVQSLPPQQQTQSAGVAFSANLTNGTISFIDSSSAAVQSNSMAANAITLSTSNTMSGAASNSSNPVKVHSKYNNNAVAQNAIQTVHNTLANQQQQQSAAQETKTSAAANKLPLLAPKNASAAQSSNEDAPTPGFVNSGVTTLSAESAASSVSTTSTAVAAAVTNAVGAPASSGAKAGKKQKPTRPSLSEQLASIGAKAEALTSDIRIKGKLESTSNGSAGSNGEGALYTMPARCFSIGSLSCRFPSPIHFFADRCEYVFNHPFEATAVNMVLYYRDMSAISILGTKFKFKLPKRLACFLTDFDPQNPHHMINIELSSMLSVSVIREKVLPLISTFK